VPPNPYDPEESETQNNEPKRLLSNHLASHYRWLPADVSVNMFGKVQFDSYINGLHPFEHKELYETISQVMEHFLPLWGRVLRDLTTEPLPHAMNRLDLSDRDSEEVDMGISDDVLIEEYEELVNPDAEEPELEEDDEEEMAMRKKKKEKFAQIKQEAESNGGMIDLLNKFVQPELAPPVDFSRTSLKVIVKIASIELTPEKHKYKGTWHIEGVPEESIISTGIYYFEEENIQTNFLHFRVALSDPKNCDIQCPMGLGFGSEMSRTVGKVQTKQGRLLAFPNTMQHCVQNVALKDMTKPGHRKLLVFFLVDPNKSGQVLSTGQVPPPCKAWYENLHLDVDDSTLQTLEEARQNRENLMFTRKFYVVSQNENLFERECTFCEH